MVRRTDIRHAVTWLGDKLEKVAEAGDLLAFASQIGPEEYFMAEFIVLISSSIY